LRLPIPCSSAANAYSLTALIALHCLSGSTPTYAADAFKRLAATEIQTRIVGRAVTDESHWSDRFESNGTLVAMELGQRKPGTWTLDGDGICVKRKARKPVEECFEIWQSRDQIEYRRDGVTLAWGVLRKE
jgi:hypothetical protein